jgi:hypothetical protein
VVILVVGVDLLVLVPNRCVLTRVVAAAGTAAAEVADDDVVGLAANPQGYDEAKDPDHLVPT